MTNEHAWFNYVQTPRPKLALEIGAGESTLWLLEHLPKLELTTVDPFCYSAWDLDQAKQAIEAEPTNRNQFLDQVRSYCGRFKLVEMPSHDFLRFCQRTFDLIHVDGSATTGDALTDMILSWLLLKQGGIMVTRQSKAVQLFIEGFCNQELVYADNVVILRKL